MYQEKFQNILTEDENIIRVEKAKLKTFIFKKIIKTIISLLIMMGIVYYIKEMAIIIGGSYSFIKYIIFVFIAIYIYDIIYSTKSISNYFVCLTNKRIIIRFGAFTNNYSHYSIDNVTGNIQTICTQSIWDKKDNIDASGLFNCSIELLPVGHRGINISTKYSIENVYEMVKEIEKVVKNNSEIHENIIKE